MAKPSLETPPVPLEPKDPARYKRAIDIGIQTLKGGGSKADAARAIFRLLVDEHREVVLRAFIEGAEVTIKGSPTYYYNISRKYKKHKQFD